MVDTPATPSLMIMIHLRLNRSTMTPTKGIRMMLGKVALRMIIENFVTDPVCCRTQIPNPKAVKDEPITEKNWPNHTTKKVFIPFNFKTLFSSFFMRVYPEHKSI